jgi:hypothetical protein
MQTVNAPTVERDSKLGFQPTGRRLWWRRPQMNQDDLRYDRWQFANHYQSMPAGAKTSIAFEDYRSMHTQRRKVRSAWVPPFALNDKQLQKVLLLRAWRYTHQGKFASKTPEHIDPVETNRAATAKAIRGHQIRKDAPPIQHEMLRRHKAAIKHAGGYMQLHAAIAFRAWRLGMDSVAVAETVAMTPQAVRQSLWRMRDTAKDLGFEVGRAGHTAGKTFSRRMKRMSFNTGQAVKLFQSGMRVIDIAVSFGYPRGQGNNRVRRCLQSAGVYPTAKSRAA